MPEVNDPIQELIITARRTQILNAATRVFAEKGFHRATIKDIARAAGIADGTIYTYFKSKTEVLLGILDRLNETNEREFHFAEVYSQDLRSFFTAYVRHRLTLVWENTEVFQAILPELLSNAELRETYYQRIIAPTTALGERYFQMIHEQGLLHIHDAPLTVRAIAGMILGLLTLHLLGDEQIATRREELPELLTSLLLDGMLPAKKLQE